ncbi:MAG: PDZ domain-containing protein, partial [Acidobacteria bacterium]|nr:PDZ domain-containing protein [Acidobacteriota bacterium]
MKLAGVLGVLLLGLVVAASYVAAPSLYGQIGGRDSWNRRLEVIGGRGSQIGVSIRDVDAADVKREKLAGEAGAVIDEVESDGPAAKAGMKAGDVVVEFDSERVRSARQFARLVQETPPRRAVKTAVMRNGQRVELQVTPDTESGLALLGEAGRLLPRDRHFSFSIPEITIPRFDFDLRARPGRLGVSVTELTPQLAQYFGARGGVLVTSVDPDSPAEKGGLKAGDVMTSIDGRRIENYADLRRELSDFESGKETTVVILRDKKELTLKVTLEGSMRPRRQIRRT